MELKDTIDMMNGADHSVRLKAEYLQTKIRYEKLKALNNAISAANMCDVSCRYLYMPVHDCPDALLRDQERVMGEYLRILEMRAVIESIDLTEGIIHQDECEREKYNMAVSVLSNCLEGMACDADDKGEDAIQPRLTLDDVRLIVKGLNRL